MLSNPPNSEFEPVHGLAGTAGYICLTSVHNGTCAAGTFSHDLPPAIYPVPGVVGSGITSTTAPVLSTVAIAFASTNPGMLFLRVV